MTTFQERLIAEKIELDEKRRKLLEFLNSPNAEKLDSTALGLLRIQECAMRTYSECLAERMVLLGMTSKNEVSAKA